MAPSTPVGRGVEKNGIFTPKAEQIPVHQVDWSISNPFGQVEFRLEKGLLRVRGSQKGGSFIAGDTGELGEKGAPALCHEPRKFGFMIRKVKERR
jgi:hypothetical protein